MSDPLTLGLIFPPDQPPEALQDVARATEEAGLDQLWIWEDCFKESGIATAAAALAWTERITLGIGLLPVPLRNVALTAMELATLERLFPGRLVAGVGHGVLEWMEQIGARAESPMTLLREYTQALGELLRGRAVTTAGRYVHLDGVRLDWPPHTAPLLLIGAVRERTQELAGELGDGVILTGEASPEDVRTALPRIRASRERSGRYGTGEVVVFVAADPANGAQSMANLVREYADAGATNIPLLHVGPDPDLVAFAAFVAEEVRPLLS